MTRGAIVLKEGELLWPAPPPALPAAAAAPAPAKASPAAVDPPNPFNETLKDTFLYSTGNVLNTRDPNVRSKFGPAILEIRFI